MELGDRRPLERRVEQVHGGGGHGQAVVAQPAPPEPERRERAGRDDDRLGDQQGLGQVPRPGERREQDQDRVDVGAEARELATGDVGRLERASLGGAPDRLDHVPDVEAAGPEGPLAGHREIGEDAGVDGHHRPDDGLGAPDPADHRSRPAQTRTAITTSSTTVRTSREPDRQGHRDAGREVLGQRERERALPHPEARREDEGDHRHREREQEGEADEPRAARPRPPAAERTTSHMPTPRTTATIAYQASSASSGTAWR